MRRCAACRGGEQRGRATRAYVWGMWRGRRAGRGRRAAGACGGGVLRGRAAGGVHLILYIYDIKKLFYNASNAIIRSCNC